MLNLCSLMHNNSFHSGDMNDDEIFNRQLTHKHRGSDRCQIYMRKQAEINYLLDKADDWCNSFLEQEE